MQPTRSNRIHNHIILSDGRKLGFAEFGPRQGKPVFYFHGFPGSRLEAKLAETMAQDAGVRFIGIDRPGFGLSDFKPKRTLADWPRDVTALADSLGVDQFSTLGVSGGGPYAAACAYLIPDRLISVGIVCGMGPVDVAGTLARMNWPYRQGLRLTRHFPGIITALYALPAICFRNYPERMLSILSGKVAAPDKIALKNNELIKVLSASFREAFHRSLRWPATDMVLYSRPWGFPLKDIDIAVYLWHGVKDRIVPPEMAGYMAQTIPNCRSIFYPDEGHFSILINRISEIWEIFNTADK